MVPKLTFDPILDSSTMTVQTLSLLRHQTKDSTLQLTKMAHHLPTLMSMPMLLSKFDARHLVKSSKTQIQSFMYQLAFMVVLWIQTQTSFT